MSESKWWVGQKVHCCAYGEGVITDIMVDRDYPIRAIFNARFRTFTEDGREYDTHTYPTLFPIDTVRPVPKVKRRIEGWVNLYQHSDGTMRIVRGCVHLNRAAADIAAPDGRKGPACQIVHEWEEEGEEGK